MSYPVRTMRTSLGWMALGACAVLAIGGGWTSPDRPAFAAPADEPLGTAIEIPLEAWDLITPKTARVLADMARSEDSLPAAETVHMDGAALFEPVLLNDLSPAVAELPADEPDPEYQFLLSELEKLVACFRPVDEKSKPTE